MNKGKIKLEKEIFHIQIIELDLEYYDDKDSDVYGEFEF